MSLVRAPLVYSMVATKCTPKGVLEFQDGYMLKLSQVKVLAELLEIDPVKLPIESDPWVNKRLRCKLRGALASFLFEHSGVFCNESTPAHMKSLGISANPSGTPLPERIMDAVYLESTLQTIITRAEHLLAELNIKFVQSEHSVTFNDQIAPGKFKLRGRCLEQLSPITQPGDTHRSVSGRIPSSSTLLGTI